MISLPKLLRISKQQLWSEGLLLIATSSLVGMGYFSWLLIPVCVLCLVSTHIYTAIQYIETDQKMYANTVATFLGKNGSLTLCMLLYLIITFTAASYLGEVIYLVGLAYVWLIRLSYQARDHHTLVKLHRWFVALNVLAVCIFVLLGFLHYFPHR